MSWSPTPISTTRAAEKGVSKKIVFSGDLGNQDQPIIRDPSFVDGADYVVMASTYGDRNHEPPESYTGALARLIDEVFSKGGNIVIPSFAVGRTQELAELVGRSRGRSNKDLTRLAEQLRQIMEKWK